MQTIYLLSFEIKIKGIILVHIEHKLSHPKTQWKEPQHSDRAILRYLLYNIYFQFKILLSNHVSRIFWEIEFGLVIFCILSFEVGIVKKFSLPRSHVGKYIRIYLIADMYIKHSELSWTICTCTRYIVYNEVLIVIFLLLVL
jgi:hypothetical protein